jgi:hypothetical protein
MRINELETRNAIDGTESIVVDTTEGTKKATLSKIFSLISVEKKTFSNISVNANSVYESGSILINKDGYSAIGIVGYTCSGAYSNAVIFNKIYVVDPWNINFKVANNGAGTANIEVEFYILYVKN